MESWRGREPPLYIGLVAGVVAVSFAAILIRMAEAPALVIAAYRMGIAAVIVGPAAMALTRGKVRIPPRSVLFCLGAALFLALHFGFWIASLERTSVASSVVLVTATPLMVAVASRIFLKEPLERRVLVGIGLGLVGAVTIASGDLRFGGRQELLGDGLALLGAVAMTGYLLFGRRVRPTMPLMPYLAVVYAASAVLLLAGSAISGASLAGYTGRTYLFLVLVALIPQVMGHSLLNWALARVSATVISVSVMAEPVVSTVLALLLLKEMPPATSLVGGVVILAGIYLALHRPAAPPPLNLR